MDIKFPVLRSPDLIPQPTLSPPVIEPPLIWANKKHTQVNGFETFKANLAQRPDLVLWTGITALELYLLFLAAMFINDKMGEFSSWVGTNVQSELQYMSLPPPFNFIARFIGGPLGG